MSNSLFNEFNSNSNSISQFNNFLTQFNQYRSTFKGNPEAQVKQFLQSGRMSQEQFNQLAETATMLRKLI